MPMLGTYAKSSLDEGTYAVQVIQYGFKTAKTGTRFLVIKVRTASGDNGEVSLPLTPDAYWKLAWFARDCGLDKEFLNSSYDVADDASHSALIGCVIRVTYKKSEKTGYIEPVEFDHASDEDKAVFTDNPDCPF